MPVCMPLAAFADAPFLSTWLFQNVIIVEAEPVPQNVLLRWIVKRQLIWEPLNGVQPHVGWVAPRRYTPEKSNTGGFGDLE